MGYIVFIIGVAIHLLVRSNRVASGEAYLRTVKGFVEGAHNQLIVRNMREQYRDSLIIETIWYCFLFLILVKVIQ